MGDKAKLAVTCGDPAGIGPEIIVRWLQEHPAETGDVVVLGPLSWLEEITKKVKVEIKAVGDNKFSALPGNPTVAGAKIALAALEAAAQGCVDGRYQAVVTAPISKSWMQKAGFHHPGHTEFFAEKWGGEPTMAFVEEKLKVVLATWHIPLMKVMKHLTEPALARAVERAAWLAEALGQPQPRLGVCGLNPHAGEDGLMGREEADFLDPALDQLRKRYSHLSRCQPADTVFHRALKGEFDVVVALYHDQGLGPLKTLEFDRAVNVTLGLPFIRTSPDHGTAFDLAGKGLASPRSFGHALTLARQLARGH